MLRLRAYEKLQNLVSRGMVHIRDLVAFMTMRAAAAAQANTRRKKPFPAGLDLKAIDLSMTLSATKIVREILYAPPSMPVLDLLAKMQTTRIHLALVVGVHTATEVRAAPDHVARSRREMTYGAKRVRGCRTSVPRTM